MIYTSFSISLNGANLEVINPNGNHKSISLGGTHGEYVTGAKLSNLVDITGPGLTLPIDPREREQIFRKLGLGDADLIRIQNLDIPNVFRAIDSTRGNIIAYLTNSNGNLAVLSPDNPSTPGFFYLSGAAYDEGRFEEQGYINRAMVLADSATRIDLTGVGRRVLVGNVLTSPVHFRAAEDLLNYPGFAQAAQIAVNSGDMLDLEDVGTEFLNKSKCFRGEPAALVCALVDREGY